ncbi:type II toxin-antitoxin system VapC family toxin [Sphingomonas sp.]|jgi:ribonuclease VapC|uniref:type II toxin-antitoxin system VapC family toxin n=1 Tax=Sphingomonas sp. TaxID=28214 RepID=UPI002ED904DC
MIVDTSALVAMLRGEAEADSFYDLLEGNPGARISAGSWVELGPVLLALGLPALDEKLHDLVRVLRLSISPVTAEQAEIGRRAYARFGKGNHRARLNFGDCFAYALAKASGEPLLFKGDDFGHTDILVA